MHFQTVIKKAEENLITSPLSADVVLSMAAFGAGGETKKQMRKVLNFKEDDSLMKSGYQSLIDSLNVRFFILLNGKIVIRLYRIDHLTFGI